jgi:hypothetical protein
VCTSARAVPAAPTTNQFEGFELQPGETAVRPSSATLGVHHAPLATVDQEPTQPPVANHTATRFVMSSSSPPPSASRGSPRAGDKRQRATDDTIGAQVSPSAAAAAATADAVVDTAADARDKHAEPSADAGVPVTRADLSELWRSLGGRGLGVAPFYGHSEAKRWASFSNFYEHQGEACGSSLKAVSPSSSCGQHH